MKRLLECYGYSTSTPRNWNAILDEEQCPFTNSRCMKQRKSVPSQTIGACVLEYWVSLL